MLSLTLEVPEDRDFQHALGIPLPTYNVVPGVMRAPNTKIITKLEAIEPPTIAIIAISSRSEFYMPWLIYVAIYILLEAWLLSRVVTEMVAELLQHLKPVDYPEAAQLLYFLSLPWDFSSYPSGQF
jgi:hypothetical protein